MKYPRIYLAIDNCFAYKRWTRPIDWATVIKDLGIKYIETSADTELDPLYMGEEYLIQWIKDVESAQSKTGVQVANLYSGHGTYTTLGLAHTDLDVRKRFVEKWFKPIIQASADLNAGFGFLVHGFPDFVLQDRELYKRNLEELYQNLTVINEYAGKANCKYLSLEQMYTPNMAPWTIAGMNETILEISKRSGKNFYFTEDVGHHNAKFIKPNKESIESMFMNKKKTGIWLGTAKAFEIYLEALKNESLPENALEDILVEMAKNPHMFSERQDCDCYEWLRTLGCYASIIHLQQTDGTGSRHLPFTDEYNEKGIIDGYKVFQALKQSYDQQPDGVVKKCDEIYMTLELFFESSAISNDFLGDYARTVEYWRQFIPEDGIRLDEIVRNLDNAEIAFINQR